MPDHRLHRYEVLHNKLSGLEELPVDCNPVEIQSVFHNPLVELAVYHHHVIIRKQVNLIRLVFQLNILHRIESDILLW